MLRPIGAIAHADAKGRLPRLGRAPSGARAAMVEGLAERIARDLGPELVALALRGSMARGTAVEGASDLDLVVVRRRGSEERQLPPANVEVEASTMTLDRCSTAHDTPGCASPWRTRAGRFRGRDVVAELPDPTLGPPGVAHLKGVERWGTAWPIMLENDEVDRRLICRWLMKRVVRAAFESVMLEIGGYTRDIYPCAEAAAERHPARADPIWRAAELAVAPADDRAAIGAVAEPLVDWLRGERAAFRARHPGWQGRRSVEPPAPGAQDRACVGPAGPPVDRR